MTWCRTILCAGLIAALYYCPVHGAAPVFTVTAIDLGTIIEGDSSTIGFSFTNPGPDSLRLEEIRSGCNCIAGPVEPQTLESGGRGEITLTFISCGLNGPQTKNIFAIFTTPRDSTGQTLAVQLTVTAFIKCEVMFLPSSIIGMIKPGTTAFSTAGELMNTSGHPLSVTALLGDSAKGVTIVPGDTLPAQLQHGQRLRFTVHAGTRQNNQASTTISTQVVAVTTQTHHTRHGCPVTVFLR